MSAWATFRGDTDTHAARQTAFRRVTSESQNWLQRTPAVLGANNKHILELYVCIVSTVQPFSNPCYTSRSRLWLCNVAFCLVKSILALAQAGMAKPGDRFHSSQRLGSYWSRSWRRGSHMRSRRTDSSRLTTRRPQTTVGRTSASTTTHLGTRPGSGTAMPQDV
jgi:hypothetical protein